MSFDVRLRKLVISSEDQKERIRSIVSSLREGNAATALDQIRQVPESLEWETPLGTLLHIAARRSDVETVTAMIALGADVNARSGISGGTPINGAASEGNECVVAALIERGAALDIDEPERNPLFAAIHNGHTEIAEQLLDAGIDYAIKYTGETMTDMNARGFAVEWGRSHIVDLLDRRAEQGDADQPTAAVDSNPE